MNELLRYITTICIWVLAIGVLITALITQTADDFTALAFLMMVGAVAGTFFLWRYSSQQQTRRVEKVKRSLSPRVERLMQQLDDEETIQLAELLDAHERDNWRHDET